MFGCLVMHMREGTALSTAITLPLMVVNKQDVFQFYCHCLFCAIINTSSFLPIKFYEICYETLKIHM